MYFFRASRYAESVRQLLHETLIYLIEKQGVDIFYIGNQGRFDRMVKNELTELKKIYPDIKYYIVLAYMPGKSDECDFADHTETLYPDGLENVPRKFAIDKRNRILIERSDIVITYVCRPFGGAAKFKEIAEKKNKVVINLFQK